MNLLRSATVAVALMLPFGLAQATTSNTPPPPLTLANSHPSFSVTEDRVLNLRETGSQIVIQTIENALQQGGLALLGEGFQLDSSLNWVFGETIEGEVDVVVPLWSRGGHIVFAQPGAVFWTGFEEEERIDGNFGVVYRTMMDEDVIGGASLFYDHDFQIGHSRLGIGIDAQRKGFYGAFNYYHPLSATEDGREGYVEDALRGMDIRLAVESDVTRFGGNVGYWKFQGDEDEDVREDWKLSFGIDAGLRIIPGVFLEGSLQRHDKDVSLGQRASVGLAFKFSLPDFKGKSYGNGGGASSLYKVVEREKRILYEEREANTPIRLTPRDENGMELTSLPAEGDTVTIAGELEALPVAAMLELVINEETSSADLGTDFNYGHKVYVLDEATEQQSEPDTVTNCPEATCEMMIPAGVTMFDVEIEILDDDSTDPKEIPEEIVLRVNVPAEHQNALRSGETTVTIRAHGNTIAFASDALTTLMENDETTGIEVSVSVDLPSPTPITLNVAPSGMATEGTDYRISTRSLTIPANASSASLTLRGIDNNVGEGSKSIVLTLSGNLPTGWTFTDAEHELTLQDDDLSIYFVASGTDATPSDVEEPDSGNTPVEVTVGITQAPTAEIKVMVAADTSASTAQASDYTFAGAELTFASGSTDSQTATLMINHDTDPEGDETIVLTLSEVGNSLTDEGSGFSLGVNHTITIPKNDIRIVSFSGSTSRLENSTTTRVSNTVNVPQRPTEVVVGLRAAADSTARVTEDYMPLPQTVTILAGSSSAFVNVSLVNDTLDELTETIILEIFELPAGFPEGVELSEEDTRHTVFILDDDVPANRIGFHSGRSATEGDEGDVAILPLEIAADLPMEAKINVDVNVSGYTLSYVPPLGSPTLLPDNVITITPGTTSFSLFVNIPEDDNNIGETVTVTLTKGSNFPPGWELGSTNAPTAWTFTVNDND